MEAYDRYEHAGVIVEIVHDDDPAINPLRDQDDAGTIYSWARDFSGDKSIREPDLEIPCSKCEDWSDNDDCPACGGTSTVDVTIEGYMAHYYDAALTIPLRFSDYGSSGARLYEYDAEDANCAICFTQEEINREWGKPRDRSDVAHEHARAYAKARVDELDQWLQGNVWGIVIREDTREAPSEDIENSAGEILESVWGFIGEPTSDWIRAEANELAEGAAEEIERERVEATAWACRDTITVNA